MTQGIINRHATYASDLKGRLWNWKFNSAKAYLDGQSIEVVDLVTALADSFGNEGTPDADEDGKPGPMEDEISQREIVLLRAVVKHLIGDEGS